MVFGPPFPFRGACLQSALWVKSDGIGARLTATAFHPTADVPHLVKLRRPSHVYVYVPSAYLQLRPPSYVYVAVRICDATLTLRTPGDTAPVARRGRPVTLRSDLDLISVA